MELKALERCVGVGGFSVGGVKVDDDMARSTIVDTVIVEPHDYEAGGLVLSCVQEGQVCLYLCRGPHAEKADAVADLQEVLKIVSGRVDFCGSRLECGVGEQRLLQRPLRLINTDDGQADCPSCYLPGSSRFC